MRGRLPAFFHRAVAGCADDIIARTEHMLYFTPRAIGNMSELPDGAANRLPCRLVNQAIGAVKHGLNDVERALWLLITR